MTFGSFFLQTLIPSCALNRPFVIAKQPLTRTMAVWAAYTLKKKQTLYPVPSWMAATSFEVVKTVCALHIREIIAGEDNAI